MALGRQSGELIKLDSRTLRPVNVLAYFSNNIKNGSKGLMPIAGYVTEELKNAMAGRIDRARYNLTGVIQLT